MHVATIAAALVLGVAPVAGAVCPPCPADVFLKVQQTTSGSIVGHLANSSECVVEYLGIPYAKPPVNDLRFAPPQKYLGNGLYEAANFGNDCPLTPSAAVDYPNKTEQAQRIIGYFAAAAGTPQGEDCLTLNIWSKATPNSLRRSKPVLVFFYGGRFAVGNTDSPFYTGDRFAEAQDIVVVTVNYRLNIFGFPGAPGETQNLGLRDQRLAVEWVRDNIANFGGDPTKIVISGQSAGGVSVDYWSYAYQADPIARGLIMHSGNAFSFPVQADGVPETNWNAVVSSVGCNATADVMSCMREVDWAAIKTAAAAVKAGKSSSVLRSIPAFYPIPDNEIVFSSYTGRSEAGEFAKLPVLMGNNNNEDGYYRIPAYANGIVPTDAQVTSFLLESFTCPVNFQAQARRNHSVPAYAYRYLADWDNTRLFPTSGAYHGVDLHMIFGHSAEVSGLPTTAEQDLLTVYMQKAWFAFANNPATGLSEFGWPSYNPTADTLAVLGQDNESQVRFVNPSVYAAPCSTVTMGGIVATTTASTTATTTDV